MSGGGGGVFGGKGGGGAQVAGGGLSQFQIPYAQYTFGQNTVANEAAFGRSGTADSTMKSQGQAGAYAGEALQAGQMSDADAAAMAQYINQQNAQANAKVGQAAGGLGSALGGLGGGGGGGGQ